MKNLYLLTFSAFVAATMTAHAENRTLDEMRDAAAAVLQSHTSAKAPGMQQNTTLQALSDHLSQMTVFGRPEGGFAYVAHDDALPAVIFYSDGCYDTMRQCPEFVEYITTLDEYFSHCAAMGKAPVCLSHKAQLGHPEGVKPLTPCLWKQNSPYNLFCPFGNDGTSEAHTITGCVGTAFAQTIFALHYNTGADITLRGARRYHYTTDDGRKSVAKLFFPSLTFDWDNMLNTYNESSTYKQGIAVAQLMYACSMAANMTFSTGGSGTHPLFASDGANLFFGGVKSKYTSDLEDHYQEIYDELDAKRCVLFNGAGGDGGGHAFVGDGYDKDGRVHLNFGWGDGYNGYSTLVSLGGWSNGQSFNTYVPCDPEPYAFSNQQPIAELRDRYCTADFEHPVEEIVEGTWYVLYNVGRCNSIYSAALGRVPQNISYIPAADATSSVAPMLVRFVKNGSETYSVQFGTGDYMGTLNYNSANGTTTSPSATFTCGHIGDSRQHWWFKQAGINLDCTYQDGIFGWKNDMPTDVMASNSWMLFPVSFSDQRVLSFDYTTEPIEDKVYTLETYTPGKNYGFNFGTTCSVTKARRSALRIVPVTDGTPLAVSRGGVHIISADDANLVVSGKNVDCKTSNGTAASDVPLTFYVEPTGESVDTGDAILDATSIVVRLRCDVGYLGTQKVALGSPAYCNLSPAAQYTRWLLTDKEAYDEMLASGISTPTVSEGTGSAYDLQGRKVLQNPSNGSTTVGTRRSTPIIINKRIIL